MTTFNTTAAKVKVNGQWTPLLALGGGGGGGGSHIATYGETTFAEVKSWFDAGETCVCRQVYDDEGDLSYIDLPLTACYPPYDDHPAEFYFCSSLGGFTNVTYILDSDNNWDERWRDVESSEEKVLAGEFWPGDQQHYPSTGAVDARFQTLANATKSTDTWSSNDTKYPTTKAVEDYVESKSSNIPCELTWGGGTLQFKAWNSGSITGTPNIDSMYPYEDFDSLFARMGDPTSASYNVGSMMIHKNVYPNTFSSIKAACLHEGKAVFSFPNKWKVDNGVGISNWLTKMLASGYGVYTNMASTLYKTNSTGNTVINDGRVFRQSVSNGEPLFNTGCQVLYDEAHTINGSYTITDPLDEHIYDVRQAIFPACDSTTFIGIEIGGILIDRNTASPGKWNKVCVNSGVMVLDAPYVNASSKVVTQYVMYMLLQYNTKNTSTYSKSRETTKFAIPFLYSSTSIMGDFAKVFTRKQYIGLIPASTTMTPYDSTCVHIEYGDMIPAPYYNGGIQSMQIEQVSKGIMLYRNATNGYPLKAWSGIKMNNYNVWPDHHRFMVPDVNSLVTVVYKSQSDEIKITNKNGTLSESAYNSLSDTIGSLRWYNGKFGNKLAGFISTEYSIPMYPKTDTGGVVLSSVNGYRTLGGTSTMTGFAMPYVSDSDPWMTLTQLQADGTTKTYNVHPFWSYRSQENNNDIPKHQVNINVGLILKDPNKAWSDNRTDDNDFHKLILLKGGFKSASVYAYNIASDSLSHKSSNYFFILNNSDATDENYALAHFTDYSGANPFDWFRYSNTFAFSGETQVKYDCHTFNQIPSTTADFIKANGSALASCTLLAQLDPGAGPSSCGLSFGYGTTTSSMGFGSFMQLWSLGYNNNNRRDCIAFPKCQMQWQAQNVPGAETAHHDIFMDLSYINATWESSSSTMGLTLQWTKVYPDFDNGVFYIYGCRQNWAANPVDMTVTRTTSDTYKKQISMVDA